MEIALVILAVVSIFLFEFIKNTNRIKPNIVPDYVSGKIKKQIPSFDKIEGTIFYHEDDYLQVEIVPKENLKILVKEAQNIEVLTQKNHSEIGFSKMYLREDVGIKLKERKIKVHDIEQFISKLNLEKHQVVSTGIRPNEMLSENTIGYGKDENAIFIEYEKDIVENMWISGEVAVKKELLITLFSEIGNNWDLLLMDWNKLQLIDLKREKQIKEYLG